MSRSKIMSPKLQGFEQSEFKKTRIIETPKLHIINYSLRTRNKLRQL